MTNFPRSVVLLTICLSVTVCVVSGLRCYQCLGITTSNDQANKILASLPGFSAKCADDVDENTEGISVQTCPNTPNVVAKCGKISVEVEASIATESVDMQMVTRSCVEEPIAKAGNYCEKATDAQKAVMRQSIAGFDVDSLDGTTCFCTTELCNGQPKATTAVFFWLLGPILAMVFAQLW